MRAVPPAGLGCAAAVNNTLPAKAQETYHITLFCCLLHGDGMPLLLLLQDYWQGRRLLAWQQW